MTTRFLRINPADNVAVAIETLPAGETVTIGGEPIRLLSEIPAGHKFALREIAEGENIVKYGYPIGHVLQPIAPGAWVNEKNIRTNLAGLLEYTYEPVEAVRRGQEDEEAGRREYVAEVHQGQGDGKTGQGDGPPRQQAEAGKGDCGKREQQAEAESGLTFLGYERASGEAGIRNEIWVIPTVGCVNGTVNALAERLRAETGGKGVDAIAAYTHNYGCSQLDDDHENTRRILRNMVQHPNAGGVLVVGLGCENNQLAAFREMLGDYDPARVKFIETQKAKNELEEGMALLREIYAVAARDKRTPVPVSKLRVGLKCGGSDGLSGITANPLLGVFSDRLIEAGGTTVLTEVPEMFGAETILMNRCRDRATFDRTVRLINDFKGYFTRNDQPVYENPSPGNKAGGISTLEEKSLGCTQKCGSAVVQDVLMYGERLRRKGLSLLSSPGNDLVAATALAAAGCQMVLFTTGRGTPFGTFVPTMKIATNTPLAESKPHWIDFNAGVIVEGQSMQEVSDRFTEYVLQVASGELMNNEKNGFREIAIFKTGVTL